jgi:hypothetical protein
MMRLHYVAMFGLLSVVGGSAATIEVGGPAGLTSNYISQGLGAVCADGAGNCVVGSTTGYAEANYDTVLFSGATSTGGTVSPAPFTGYSTNTATPVGSTLVGGTTFSMISDGTSDGLSNNFWASTGTDSTADTITVPIGIYGVKDLWTMLNNEYGTLGGNDTTVTFNFGTSSNVVTSQLVVALANNNGAANNGELRSAVACSTASGTLCTDTPNTTNSRGSQQTGVVINGATVNTGTPYSFTYSNATGPFYGGSQGKVKLDDQEFVFPVADTSLWLVSVSVTENLSNTMASAADLGNGALPSETVLSAITVDTTPEPAAILLLLSGLGGIGLLRLRRN